MTLLDFANEKNEVILRWISEGTPAGAIAALYPPDLDFAEDRDLYGLEGEIDDSGRWQWDGEGEPTDYQQNSIRNLSAHVSPEDWQAEVDDYLSQC